ncbi:patatin-like phospholipase domain-containing protein [Elioraea rosea]|uniref:hypothetical protein n=1 Tax=Elioraea rosea TaxID=2492390 RepID=UPI0011847D87|nr:hypothetical protein [Elioraea rosea]
MARYRILSLDGGGAWAMLEVWSLIQAYGAHTRGHDVLAEFDLAASNSGGSLVLGGLLMDITLAELMELFRDEARRRQIFAGGGNWPARYRCEGKLAGLRAILGPTDMALPEVASRIGNRGRKLPHVIIAAYGVESEKGILFRSDLNAPAAPIEPADAPRLPSITLAEAIHASSNAPVLYFDDVARTRAGNCWDGAIAGWNCPAAVAVVEALTYGWRADEIALLSLGTANVLAPDKPLPPSSDDVGLKLRRLGAEVGMMLRAILKEPANGAPFHAHVMLGGALPTNARDAITDGPVVRLNPMPGPTTTDPPHAVLAKLDMDAVLQSEVAIIERLGQRWLSGQVPNEPVRMQRTTGHPDIGHRTATEALAAWAALAPRRV